MTETNERKAGGRPPVEERRKQWDVRLTIQELQLIERAAQAANLQPRVWARQQLLDAAKRGSNVSS